MNRSDFTALLKRELETLIDLNETKGREYAGESDALDNFKRHGKNLDLDSLQIWAVYASKHWDAILSFIRTGDVLSEPIDGRIEDLALYLFLLLALIRERTTEAQIEHEVTHRPAPPRTL